MTVEQMQKALVTASEIYREAGDGRTSAALANFAHLLEGHGGKNVSKFAELIQKANGHNRR